MYTDRTHGWRFLLDLIYSWIYSWIAVIPRPIRRFLLTCVVILLIFALIGPVNSFYKYIIDFYIPSLAVPVKRDLSKLPVIKKQLTFINRIIEPTPRKDDTFLLILISSGAAGEIHVRKRMAIRKTWGKISADASSWRMAFFLGLTHIPSVNSQRMTEAKKYGDMLIADFPDTYRNITKKLMMAFKWASEQQYMYLLKTDDDVYINVPSLIEWIKSSSTSPLYAGVLYRGNVNRDPHHRHYISPDDLSENKYPWYPKGALYILSGKLVKEMITLSTKVKQITTDDAYVGIMASYLGVKPIAIPSFIQSSFMPGFLEYFDQCTYSNIFGIGDNLSPSNIYFVHQQVLLAKDSSKWMCIHVNNPLLIAVVTIIVLVTLLVIVIRTTSTHINH